MPMLTRLAGLAVLVAAVSATIVAQAPTTTKSTYLTPPKAIAEVMDAAPLPAVSVSPTHDRLVLSERRSMPGIAEVAAPMLRIGGMRINPKTNGMHNPGGTTGIVFKSLADSSEKRLTLPAGGSVQGGSFSPDGKRYAFTVARPGGLEQWVADAATAQAKAVTDATLNGVGGSPCQWTPDSGALLCRFVPPGRGPAPAMPAVPTGPNIQENMGKAAPVATFQDVNETEYDDDLFEYYFTSQLAFVDPASGRKTSLGKPGMYNAPDVAPGGEYLLVERVKRPFVKFLPVSFAPRDVEIWTKAGTLAHKIADLPSRENVPMLGVVTGPRAYSWKPTAPATVTWVEALDGGDLKNQVPHRDKVVMLAAPFKDAPTEIAKTQHRYAGLMWTEKGLGLLTESERQRRRVTTWVLDDSGTPRKVWDRSQEAAYDNPGTPMFKEAGGGFVIIQNGESIYLSGQGSTPTGDRPFLDRLDLKTLKTERLFRADDVSYESVVALLSEDGSKILTRHESKTMAPNYYVRTLPGDAKKPVTSFKDPAPAIRGIQSERITYKRKDGVGLNGTLYLPPGYQKGQKVPLLMWAYPREFTDPDAAGQVTGSTHRFMTLGGASHLLFLLHGYAVLDDPKMPIVGPGETANDTYVDQLVASAQAAVDKVVEMGVTERDRVLVGGHSYGAFMTANLLAHSDLFRAGLARSGAYNRTLTPFGFQAERRPFWEVPDIYGRMSPFYNAHKINEPILLIHGEADDNSGTFPIQSERLFMALKGMGKTVRYVTLPNEAHGYRARETNMHVVTEMLNWADKWVKNAGARQTDHAAK